MQNGCGKSPQKSGVKRKFQRSKKKYHGSNLQAKRRCARMYKPPGNQVAGARVENYRNHSGEEIEEVHED